MLILNASARLFLVLFYNIPLFTYIQAKREDNNKTYTTKIGLELPKLVYLTLEEPSKIASDTLLFFYLYLLNKIKIDVSFESSTKQRISMKYQVLFSLKNNEKISRLSSAAVGTCTFKIVNHEFK